MAEIQKLLSLVKPDIEKVEKIIRNDLKDLYATKDALLAEILEYGLLSGGKRLRPLLAVISSRMCGGGDETAYKLAVCFEYLHVATLMHDDVIDQAETRRGKATVSKKFGLSAAILAGDFLHTRSMEIVGTYGPLESLSVFCSATKGMVDGEFLQLRNSKNYHQSEKNYFSAIEGKTALLIAAATEIGGIHGGATHEQRQALHDYGKYLGFGFQIADDILDYLGDQQKTGKAVGNDLAEGKMTLPLIYTLENASADDRGYLLQLLQDEKGRSKSFSRVKELIESYHGFAQARERAKMCIEKALASLDIFLPENNDDVNLLHGLAQYALSREK